MSGIQGNTSDILKSYFHHNGGQRFNTNATVTAALRKQYPKLSLTTTAAWTCDLISYANSGHATATPIQDASDELPTELKETVFLPPYRRSGGKGLVMTAYLFGKFMFKWQGYDFIVYLVDGADEPYPSYTNYYILSADDNKTSALIAAAGTWGSELHEEIWVFDGGFWGKSAELYASVMKASWEDVILDEDMKKAIINDHISFFKSEETYTKLRVPWKRGLILYGPPGNGKTISVKAMMNMLYKRKPQVPTLYVRSLKSFMGPESSISQIFSQARRYAPCYLVFEDLDSIVSDDVRSYFLNEVDGLKSNDGIFMVGSTNHLDRLDPGIAKRPSRFDRKYLFPDPNLDERIAYCKFWQSKLSGNKEIEFPDKLCKAIAKITDGFSFAYMQEAFVAALLALARRDPSDELADDLITVELKDDWIGVLGKADDDDDDLNKLVLWVEIKKQIEILREGMGNDNEE